MKLNKKIISDLIKEALVDESKNQMILEYPPLEERRGRFKGKFKRVMDILGPSEQSMKGFGVMSGENPMGQQSSSFDNERRMNELKAMLKEKGHSFEDVKGKFFNNDENSLVIPDIDIRSMAAFSSDDKFRQHSFIFGKKDKVGEDIHVHYYFVELKYDDSYDMAGYQVTDHRTSVFQNAEIQKRTDMFSQAGGKKFYIPFFDDAEEIGGDPQVAPKGAAPNPTAP